MLLTKMLLLYYPFLWSSPSSFSPPPSHPRRQVNDLVKTCNFDLPSKELHQVLSTASRSPHKKCCGQKMETDPSTLLKCIIISSLHCPGGSQAQCGMSHGQYILYQPVQQGQAAFAVLANYKLPRNSVSDYKPEVQQLAVFHILLYSRKSMYNTLHIRIPTLLSNICLNKNKEFC